LSMDMDRSSPGLTYGDPALRQDSSLDRRRTWFAPRVGGRRYRDAMTTEEIIEDSIRHS
jgi:hypothetical protein